MTAEGKPSTLYANVMQATLSPFDVILDFGIRDPKSVEPEDFEIVARLAMSVTHVKSMLPILHQLIDEYERATGVPVPSAGSVVLKEQP
jgi:hypothetical protein